jgi:hypothetical protein
MNGNGDYHVEQLCQGQKDKYFMFSLMWNIDKIDDDDVM